MTHGRRSLDGLDDDVRDHLDRETQEKIDNGMAPDEARHAALRAFGNVTRAMEDTRAVWIPVWLDQLLQDGRYGLRMLRRNPAFSAVVILTLAVGIGLSTAVFSVVNAVLVRPLSYPDPERLVWVATFDDRGPIEAVVAPDFLAFREQASSLERIAAFSIGMERVTTKDEVVPARIATVSHEFWDLAGTSPALGRIPSVDEDSMVLSHAFFERSFSGDPTVVGRPIIVNGRQVLVAGVLPAGFRAQLPPPSAASQLQPGELDGYHATIVRPPAPGEPGVRLFNVLAKMKPEVTIEQTKSELETIRANERRADRAQPGPPRLRVVPLSEKLVGRARTPLLILLAAVVLVLAIACANIANLLLARASARQKEVAIRTAVGAGRGRMLRQFVVESLILALIGGAAALLVARASLAVMLRLIPQAVPRLAETTIDGRVLAFALATSIATAFAFGVAPAVALWRTNVHDALKDGARTATASARGLRVRRALVAVELGLAAVLLVGAALLVQSFWRITRYPPGFTPDRVLTMKFQFSGPRYREAQPRRAYLDELLRRARSAPGVEAAGVSSNGDTRMLLVIEGSALLPMEKRPGVSLTETSAGYAAAIGMRVVKGRWIADQEPSPVYVINEALARRHFPGEDPIGKRILLPNGPDPSRAQFVPVVGVVADLRYANLEAAAEPELLTDYGHTEPFGMNLVIRTAGDPSAAAPAIRALLTSIDPTQPLFDVKPLDVALADSIAPRRFTLILLGTFAASALLLALFGIYGVIAYSVTQRTHEIGVRLALGAERRDVVRLVVRQGMTIATAGILMGVAAALAITRVIAGLLYEVTPTDPPTFAVVVGVLGAAAFVACCGPALRAARVDPLVALRYE
jgi:predicted permease